MSQEQVCRNPPVRPAESMMNYCKQRRRSEWIDIPGDGQPEGNFLDALRGGIRDALPNGALILPAH